jgi:hypothetical protein
MRNGAVDRAKKAASEIKPPEASLFPGVTTGLGALLAVCSGEVKDFPISTITEATAVAILLSGSFSHDWELTPDQYLSFLQTAHAESGVLAAALLFRLSCANILSRYDQETVDSFLTSVRKLLNAWSCKKFCVRAVALVNHRPHGGFNFVDALDRN